ncbi:MAG: ABC transporter ATP-binding protein, partial [Flavobacteriales bacterium]|nr:ABC transporter ATP-binding protein [Flavobacteriales bacterium]
FLEPEILVIDEVLAVGDAEFQKKAIGKMQDISRGEGRTVLFVSHNMAAVKSLCTRAVVLEHGKTTFSGGTNDAIEFYLNKTREKALNYTNPDIDTNRNIIKEVNIITNTKNSFQEHKKDLQIEIIVYSKEKIISPAVSYQIINNDGLPLIHELILNDEHEFCQTKGVFMLTSKIKNIKLYQGEYRLNVFFADNFSKTTFHKLIEICDFEIINTHKRPYYWDKGSAIYKEYDTQWDVKKKDESVNV